MRRTCGTYLMLERLMVIQNVIQQGHFPTLVQIQQSIENRLGTFVSISTINRDLLFLRTRADCPIEYNKQERGYYVANKEVLYEKICLYRC